MKRRGKWPSSSFPVPWENIARLCALCCCPAQLEIMLFLKSSKEKTCVDLKSKKAEDKRDEEQEQEQREWVEEEAQRSGFFPCIDMSNVQGDTQFLFFSLMLRVGILQKHILNPAFSHII